MAPSQEETVAAVGLKFVADPVANAYHYALLDPCSISVRFASCAFPSGAADDGYIASLSLSSGAVDTVATATIDANADEPQYTLPLLLAPGQTKSIVVRISPSGPQVTGVIYQVTPQLTVTDAEYARRHIQQIAATARLH